MTLKEFAKMLDGREYLHEITKEEEAFAKELGFVVVFGYSDDNAELRGAIDDEIGCYDGGVLEHDALPGGIYADWCPEDIDCSWAYRTSIPHENFNIYEDGELYCVGIVCDINKSKKTNADRIRAMSDEELVVFLDGFSGRCLDCAENAKNESCQIYKDGHYCRPQDVMEWLQQPADGDDHAYLKPCPFCGGEAKLFHPCDGVHLVQCSCCGCGTTYMRTEIGAVRMWNRRFGEANDVW